MREQKIAKIDAITAKRALEKAPGTWKPDGVRMTEDPEAKRLVWVKGSRPGWLPLEQRMAR